MTLPTDISTKAEGGHAGDHATLKVDYDSRHPDAPLPVLGGGLIDGRQSHDVIHELLAKDFNGTHGGDLQTELPPAPSQQKGFVALVGSSATGHIAAHNALHAACNDRNREETAT